MSEPAPSRPDLAWDWQHLHPLSPLLRGGFVLLAMLTWVVSQSFGAILGALGLGEQGGQYGGEAGADEVFAHPLLFGVGALGLVALIAAGSWLSWRFARFRVAAGQVELRAGILFRQHRQVPLERVQAVEISRPLLARVFGLAQVVVQSAGGRDSQLTLSFLGLQRSHEVRDHLLDLAGRSDEAGPAGRAGGIPAPPEGVPLSDGWGGVLTAHADQSIGERPVLGVPNGRLFLATILHTSTAVLVILVIMAAGAAGAGAVGALTGLVPAVLGIGGNRVGELLKHGNFSLARLPAGLRLRHGLTDLRTTTIPLHRVQAIEILQPLWWRPFGWWRVHVNVAGVHGERGAGDTTTVLPVGTFEDVLLVVGLLDAALPQQTLAVAAVGRGGEPGWTAAGRRSRVLDPLSWRRNGYAVSDGSVIVRRGRFTRSTTVTPHARIQSLTLTQGVVERALGLASVRFVSAPGPVSPGLPHLSVAEAERLLGEEAARARRARKVRLPLANTGRNPVDYGISTSDPHHRPER